MSDQGDDNFIEFIYRGEEDRNVIPEDVTRLIVDKSVKAIPSNIFDWHRNLIEVICHKDVKKIAQQAFNECHSLRRVIMPGVEIVEWMAFAYCKSLTDVECGNLEIVESEAFLECESLKSIELPSTRTVKWGAFRSCEALVNVNFGSKLEVEDDVEGQGDNERGLNTRAFDYCPSLERLTIPLKDGLTRNETMFTNCKKLKHVDLVEEERALLQKTISALNLEEWRIDMNEEIDSINHILPNAPAGGWNNYGQLQDAGDKARSIQRWIRSVLGKIVHYQAEHQRFLNVAAAILQLPITSNPPAGNGEGLAIRRRIISVLQFIFHYETEGATAPKLALPKDIVMNNILPFLALPPFVPTYYSSDRT